MATPNDSIRELQSTLMDTLRKLDAKLDNVTDPDLAEQIVREMQEVSHRITLAGSLLFAAQAQELDDKVAGVTKGTKKVNAAIIKIKNVTAFLSAMSEFLALVDDAIDLAKTLML